MVGVCVRRINGSALIQRDVGMGIVHDAVGLRDAGRRKVVCEAERVTRLMGCQLANARQDHLEHRIIVGLWQMTIFIWSQQTFSDEVILAPAQRT